MKFYERTYHNLVNSAKLRGLDKSKLEGYYECHHIVPKSLGGSDLPENLVLLTAREHFLAHWLLTRFTTSNCKVKMLHALNMMGNSRQEDRLLTARQYAICKKAQSEAMSISSLARVEAGTHHFQSPEARQATSERIKAEAKAGNHTAQSPRFRLAQSERMRLKITCEHCCKSTNTGQIGRNHGDKCKLLTEIGSHCLLTDKPTDWQICSVDGCDFGCRNSKGGMTKHMKKHHS